MVLDDGPPGARSVCDPLPGRNRDLLERRPEDAGGGGVQAVLLDGVLCGVVPPRLLPGHHAQTGHSAMGGTVLSAPRPLHTPRCEAPLLLPHCQHAIIATLLANQKC